MTMNSNAFNELLNLLNEVYHLNNETLNEIKGYYDDIYNNLSAFSEFLQSELEWTNFDLKNIDKYKKEFLVSVLLRHYFDSYFVDYDGNADEFEQSLEKDGFDIYTQKHIGRCFIYNDKDLSESLEVICREMTEKIGCTLFNTTVGEPNLIIIKQPSEQRIVELVNELGIFQ